MSLKVVLVDASMLNQGHQRRCMFALSTIRL